MPKLASPSDIEYLVFEGGGGQGFVYLGAMRALEELEILPLGSRNDGNVRGVSGGSVGALFALLLTLGYDSDRTERLLSDESVFNAFYDGPDINRLRHVSRNRFRPDAVHDWEGSRAIPIARDRVVKRKSLLRRMPVSGSVGTALGAVTGAGYGAFVAGTVTEPFLQGFGAAAAAAGLGLDYIAGQLKSFLRTSLQNLASKKPAYGALVRAVTRSDVVFEDYLYNVFFDRGVFPGFMIRGFIQRRIIEYLHPNENPDNRRFRQEADTFTFEQLRQRTGVDFVASGVNMTTHRPGWFRAMNTPNFPVIDAVAISSCYPIFKPVLVTNCQGVDDGYWSDGGFLNNLPLHAFDRGPDMPLNAGVLGLRLEGTPEPKEPAGDDLFDELPDWLGDVLGTLMYPSEPGQIRTEAERNQIITLDSSGLNTVDFVPPAALRRRRIEDANSAVRKYFGAP